MTNYNGYINRSTWLAVVWLDNTSKEVNDEAIRLAKNGDSVSTVAELKTLLLSKTGYADEVEKHTAEINWNEVIEHLTA